MGFWVKTSKPFSSYHVGWVLDKSNDASSDFLFSKTFKVDDMPSILVTNKKIKCLVTQTLKKIQTRRASLTFASFFFFFF